ncbi:MAG: glycosyltransferase [Oscillospiraceae bacterium]|nr:glycosyltransferase [Oscillospiraceae bacterium]
METNKITVINYYYLFPVDNGGKMAIQDFYLALSKWFKITIVCLVFDDLYQNEIYINNHLKVISLPVPIEFHNYVNKFYDEYIDSNTDPAFIMTIVRECHMSNSLVMTLKELSIDSSIIITEHMYTYRIAKLVAKDKKLWYRAQNVEYDYKIHTWKSIDLPNAVYQELFDIENECCNDSDLILTITDIDANRFIELYGVSKNKILNISAGYSSLDKIDLVLPSQRNNNKTSKSFMALFISSYSEVALSASYEIINMAKELPNVEFYIVGNVGNMISIKNLPKNMIITGLVSDNEKNRLLQSADVALNPITGGSGLNIKMLEYFAYGIPVICTTFGVRGISVENGVNCIVVNLNEFITTIQKFMKLSIDERDRIAYKAHELYIKDYTWDNCALKVVKNSLNDINIYVNDWSQFLHNDIRENAINIIDKYKSLYIYGAGEWGKSCLKFLNEFGISPIAFLDNDKNKWNNYINNIPIQSPEQTLIDKNNCHIIFALANYTMPISNFIQKDYPQENLIIAYRGEFLFRYLDGYGRLPFYLNHQKLKNAIETIVIE